MKNSILLRLLLAFSLFALLPTGAQAQLVTPSILGTLYDGGNAHFLPAGHIVLLRADDQTFVADAVVQPDGSFRFDAMPAGRYTLHSTMLGYQPHQLPVQVAPQSNCQPTALGHLIISPVRLSAARLNQEA